MPASITFWTAGGALIGESASPPGVSSACDVVADSPLADSSWRTWASDTGWATGPDPEPELTLKLDGGLDDWPACATAPATGSTAWG